MYETPEQIRQRGLKALRDELGQAGLIKFMRLFVGGSGDYTKDRVSWAESFDLDALRKEIKERKKKPQIKAKRGSSTSR
ncbi:MAG: hypothetical protein QM703_20615 [Gemmatales bacterium]